MFFRKNDQDELSKQGAVNAFAAFGYILAVALVLSSLERLMGGREDGFLAPVAFLSLLVLSAAVMASLFFGRPAMLYVDGKKKEALAMLCWTMGTFAALAVTTLAVMILMSAR